MRLVRGAAVSGGGHAESGMAPWPERRADRGDSGRQGLARAGGILRGGSTAGLLAEGTAGRSWTGVGPPGGAGLRHDREASQDRSSRQLHGAEDRRRYAQGGGRAGGREPLAPGERGVPG